MKSIMKRGVSSAAIIALVGVTPTFAQEETGESASNDRDTIVVTARKRAESLQDVPLSVQALDTEQLAKEAIRGLEDYAKKLPALTYSEFLPGGSIIVFRGATSTAESFVGTSSSALYLDEIPLQDEGFNPDVRLVDMARIEAVSGPQPTTYGASSQSGTLKFVTNKPDLSEYGGYVDVSGSLLQDGDEGYDINAAINLPLIQDKLALRIAGWRAEEGGFVDNVAGSSAQTHLTIPASTGITQNRITNDAFVRDDIGKLETHGVRASLRWQVNDDWTVDAMVQWQDTETDGILAYQPGVGDLDVVRFNDEITTDKWYGTLLKIEGDLGFADLTMSTAFNDREFFYQIDMSAYWSRFNNGDFGAQSPYLTFAGYSHPVYTTYFSSVTGWTNTAGYFTATDVTDQSIASTIDQNQSRFSQEIRLTSKDDGSRIQWMLGGYYEKYKSDFVFLSLARDWGSGLSAYLNSYYLGVSPNEPGIQYRGVEDVEIEQWAVFAEFGYDITDRLNILGGARYYDITQDNSYLTLVNDDQLVTNCTLIDPTVPFDCATDAMGNPLPNQNTQPDDGFVTLVTLSYDFTDDIFGYFTRSTGFRTGGPVLLRPGSDLPPRYSSDTLVNYEIGLKTELLDGRLIANISAYHVIWKDLQLNVNDPTTNIGFGSAIVNAGRAVIDGVEANFSYDITDSLSIDGSAAWIDARSTEEVTLRGIVTDTTGLSPADLDFVFLGDGDELPLSPDFKFNVGIEKTFPFRLLDDGAEGYIRFDYTWVGDQLNATPGSLELTDGGQAAPLTQPQYDLGRIGIGFTQDSWSVNFSVNNLWNERPVLFDPPRFPDNRIYTARPREYTLNIRKEF